MVDEKAQRVRVMTWNIWWRFGRHWQDRQPGIMQTLGRIDPDVVALQAVWGSRDTSQAHAIAADLGWSAAFAEPSYPPVPRPVEHPDQDGLTLGVAVLSRWPITATRVVELPSQQRPHDPVSLVATVAHPAGPLHVVATCLEFEPAHNDDRVSQGEQLVALATDRALDGELPVFVLGDLKAAPGSPVLGPLDDVLTDAWTAGAGDPAAVTLPSSHPAAPVEAAELIDQRIDHVYVRPGQPRQRVLVDSVALAGNALNGTYPSDHRAVGCDVSWHETPEA